MIVDSIGQTVVASILTPGVYRADVRHHDVSRKFVRGISTSRSMYLLVLVESAVMSARLQEEHYNIMYPAIFASCFTPKATMLQDHL